MTCKLCSTCPHRTKQEGGEVDPEQCREIFQLLDWPGKENGEPHPCHQNPQRTCRGAERERGRQGK